MRHCWPIVSFAALALSVEGLADEGHSSTVPAPTPARPLAGDDLQHSQELQQQIDAAETADDYREAVRLHTELWNLRNRLQGKDHWETVNQTWQLDRVRKLAARSPQDRAAWRTAYEGANRAQQLDASGEYERASELFADYRRLCERFLGTEHPLTADSYVALAGSLQKGGKSVEAQALLQQSLEVRLRVLGDQHPGTATSYNNLAYSLNEQGNPGDARELLDKSLQIRVRVLGEEHPDTVSSYNNLAFTLCALGKLAEAQPLFRKALDLRIRLLGEENIATAVSYTNMGGVLRAQGAIAEAQPLFQKSLDLHIQLLGERHPDTANCYGNLASILKAQGNYPEARRLFQHSLDLYRELLGDEHPRTAGIFDNLASTVNELGEFAEAERLYRKSLELKLKLYGERHPDTVITLNNLANNLGEQGRFAEAQPLLEKALECNKELFGDRHPRTATSYSSLAANLNGQGKYSDALPMYQKALDLRIEIFGERHPDTAQCFGSLGLNLNELGCLSEALPLLQKSVSLSREVLGDEHPYTATSYTNLAVNLAAQGQYREAYPLLQKALELSIHTFGENHPKTADCYGNLAANLQHQGKYADAEALLRKALDVRRAAFGERHPDIAQNCSDLAFVLEARGNRAEAESLMRTAIALQQELFGEKHPDTARSYDNLARVLRSQGRLEDAVPLVRKSLALRQELLGDQHPDTAMSFNNLGILLSAQRQFPEAQLLSMKALELTLQLLGKRHPDTSRCYDNVASILIAQQKYADAVPYLVQAAASYESARLSVATSGLGRAQFGVERSPYALLAATQARLGDADLAWRAAEADLARGMNDESPRPPEAMLKAKDEGRITALNNQIDAASESIMQLLGQRSPTAADQTRLARHQREREAAEDELADLGVALSLHQIAALESLQAVIQPGAALVLWVDVNADGVQEHWGCVVRPTGEPVWEQLPASEDAKESEKTTAASLPKRLATALSEARPGSEIAELAQQLHQQRIAPLERHLEGVRRLYVVPVGEMAGVPVEVLTDRYEVSYVPSGTFLARLKDRPAPQGASLLALGDPVFPTSGASEEPPLPSGGLLITQVVPGGNADQAQLLAGDVLLAYAGTELSSVESLGQLIEEHEGETSIAVSVWRDGQITERKLGAGRLGVALHRQPAPEAIAARRQTDQLLASVSRGGEWAELPGTAVELARLSALVAQDQATVLMRADARESALDQLRADGKLKDFRYLHFATHGEPNNVRAFESALILADEAQDSQEVPVGDGQHVDGRLTASEVLEDWELDADLVTLSACESALGRPGGGDGLLGFAQAFLLAGARSVCLSLWKVDDTATALLMDRFYQNVLGKRDGLEGPLPKSAALAEAKQWLRNLTEEEAAQRAADLSQGVARGRNEPALPLVVPPTAAAEPDAAHPFAHPRFWAAFVLIGDPG